MDHRLIEGLMEAIAPLIKTYVDERIAKEVAPLHDKIKEYEAREPLKGEPGKDADMSTVIAAAAAEVQRLIPAAVDAAIEALPKMENGKDADPDVIRSLVLEEVAKLPPAVPGKDADPVEVANLLVDLMPVPANGKDADPAVIAEMIAAEVAKLPPAAAGKDADPVAVADLVSERMGSIIADEVRKTLEVWPRPADGKSVAVDDVRPLLEEMVSALLPAAAGKDADPAEVAALIVEEVAKLMPIPVDGKSVTVDDVLPVLEEMVDKAVAARPVPKDGKDGVGLAGALIGRSGEFVVTLSDGTTKDLGVIVGKDADQTQILRFIEEKIAEIPVPKDGRDGFGFEDLEASFDGERTIGLKFTRGDQVKEFSFKMPVVIDRGVFKEAREHPYEKGDGVTFGGSFWIAQKDAPEGKPQDGSKDWRLSVKRGRNGADGVVRTLPPQGPVKA